jgi:hypothetical protein
VRSIVVTVRQVSASPETWDWFVDWTNERANTRQRSSGTTTAFDVAMDRARDEMIRLRHLETL